MSTVQRFVRQRVLGMKEDLKEIDDASERYGIKVDLDKKFYIRSEHTERISDLLDDPRIDVDMKIREMNKAIIYNMQFGAPADDKDLMFLFTKWKVNIWRGWKILMGLQRRYATDMTHVKYQEIYLDSNGMNHIVEQDRLVTDKQFRNLVFKYQVQKSEEITAHNLGFMPLEVVHQPSLVTHSKYELGTEAEMLESIESFGEVEVIPRAEVVWVATFRKEHVAPPAPIVLHLGQQMGGMMPNKSPSEVPVFGASGTFKKSTKESMAAV